METPGPFFITMPGTATLLSWTKNETEKANMTTLRPPKHDVYPAAIRSLTSDTAPDGTRVFWADPSFANLDLLSAQSNFAAPVLTPGQVLLKQARQRFVFRHWAGGMSYVFKLFPLSFIGSRLRHPKYAYREFSNMQTVAKLGVPTPTAIAFLEKRKRGLVSCSVIIQQDLNGYTDLLALAQSDNTNYASVMDCASDVLCMMFDKGVNHVDLRDENIMIDTETGDWRVIDWQYASITTPRAEWLLEYLVAYYIRLSPTAWRPRLMSEWVSEIYARSEHATPFKVFEARVAALVAQKSKVKSRLTLRPVI